MSGSEDDRGENWGLPALRQLKSNNSDRNDDENSVMSAGRGVCRILPGNMEEEGALPGGEGGTVRKRPGGGVSSGL